MTTPNVSKNIEYAHCAIIDETLKSSIIGTNAVVTMDWDVAKIELAIRKINKTFK